MTNSEAYLIAYLSNLVEHGHGSIPITIMLDKINDAFHTYKIEETLDANGKKLYAALTKEL